MNLLDSELDTASARAFERRNCLHRVDYSPSRQATIGQEQTIDQGLLPAKSRPSNHEVLRDINLLHHEGSLTLSCTLPDASSVGLPMHCLSPASPCQRKEVVLSRRDALHASGTFDLVLCSSARCYPKRLGAAAEECDFFLSVSISGIVYPAAELPLRTLGQGATVVHINSLRFDISSREHFLQGSASTMMQALISEAFS